MPKIPSDHAALLAAADRSLYSAKDGGRDRLVMSGQVLAWPKPGAREIVAAIESRIAWMRLDQK